MKTKHFSYFFYWCVIVFSSSFYYNFFWDIFYDVYFQKSEVMVYGFSPAGMPPFNWKINLIIWLSGIVMIGLLFGLTTDSVCKSQYKDGKRMSLTVVVLNKTAAVAAYVWIAVLSNYNERLYYMPLFLVEIISSIFPNAVTAGNLDVWHFWITVFHGIVFLTICAYFYYEERKKQHWRLEREEEYRKEREEETVAS